MSSSREYDRGLTFIIKAYKYESNRKIINILSTYP